MRLDEPLGRVRRRYRHASMSTVGLGAVVAASSHELLGAAVVLLGLFALTLEWGVRQRFGGGA